MVDQPVPAEQGLNPVSDAELDEVFRIPAVFVNKSYLTASGITIRLTFGEQRHGKPPRVHTAVAMTVADLIHLRDLITRTVEKAQLIEFQPEPKKTDAGSSS
jgi:hypothetical protein